jgi:RimJ/RimL family protein N-acetyltransferase
MIIITETKDKELIKSIITNEHIWELAGYSGNKDEYEPDLTNTWLKIELDRVLVGIFKLRKFTEITVDGHIHILPEFRNKIIANDAIKESRKYLKEKSNYKNVITTVPISCEHVMKLMDRVGFKVCGAIHNGIIYQDRLEDLIVYELTI